jgi:flagellar biogenesis protein FliO
MTDYVVRALVALLALAVLAIVAWVVARRCSSAAFARQTGHLSVVEILPISVNARLLLVRAGKRVFLIALTGQSSSLLAELRPEDLSDDPGEQAHADS